eukprot:Pgem_evm1s12795
MEIETRNKKIKSHAVKQQQQQQHQQHNNKSNSKSALVMSEKWASDYEMDYDVFSNDDDMYSDDDAYCSFDEGDGEG